MATCSRGHRMALKADTGQGMGDAFLSFWVSCGPIFILEQQYLESKRWGTAAFSAPPFT